MSGIEAALLGARLGERESGDRPCEGEEVAAIDGVGLAEAWCKGFRSTLEGE